MLSSQQIKSILLTRIHYASMQARHADMPSEKNRWAGGADALIEFYKQLDMMTREDI